MLVERTDTYLPKKIQITWAYNMQTIKKCGSLSACTLIFTVELYEVQYSNKLKINNPRKLMC